jgi:hypothetical protein
VLSVRVVLTFVRLGQPADQNLEFFQSVLGGEKKGSCELDEWISASRVNAFTGALAMLF